MILNVPLKKIYFLFLREQVKLKSLKVIIKYLIHMKKILIACSIFFYAHSTFAAVPESYVREVERISAQYSADMKFFLRSLDPKLSQFNPQQESQFCGIVKKYVDDMYKTTDENRQYLPPSAQSMTKQNVIDKVMLSPEMQLLKKYNIQCDLK